ncbi:RNA-binding protein 5-like protein [Leptomonas seymouri]|uniref:RNA-binding protein 5-like protein n=1 Tax=Leptomonas seymouri TaxID=5684 RepID=A0A0N0P379_LEPSE|nr:RNA-binding protein 5-like protein [Leptomonas seymouri]|eukprot:KPI83347.1 RNA-binding protein 5-like protein [Leptomonas seymouri]
MSSAAVFPSNGNTAAVGQNRNVYIASLPLYFDDQQLHNLFSPYGRIISARIMRAKKSHLSKGYGFVMYREARAAEQAIKALHGCVVGGLRIQVRWASADASTTFSNVSHAPALWNAPVAAANTTATTTAATPTAAANAHGIHLTASRYTPQVQSQAYTFIAPIMQYEQALQSQPGATAIALPQNYGALLNSPVATASSNSMTHSAFAPQSSPQPVHVMVLPNGDHLLVQLNQLCFQNV